MTRTALEHRYSTSPTAEAERDSLGTASSTVLQQNVIFTFRVSTLFEASRKKVDQRRVHTRFRFAALGHRASFRKSAPKGKLQGSPHKNIPQIHTSQNTPYRILICSTGAHRQLHISELALHTEPQVSGPEHRASFRIWNFKRPWTCLKRSEQGRIHGQRLQRSL